MLCSAALLLSMAAAAFATPIPPAIKAVEIHNMDLACKKANPDDALYSCTLTYIFHDPNALVTSPSVEPTTTCSHTWEWDGVTADNGPLNNYNSEKAYCFNNFINRSVYSTLVKFASPSEISLEIGSTFYYDEYIFRKILHLTYSTPWPHTNNPCRNDKKSIRNLFINAVPAALKSTSDTETYKTWSNSNQQIFTIIGMTGPALEQPVRTSPPASPGPRA
ncbi:hypothetical protein BROUX41_002414 [Berkeleyomyces rouxiae]|uniref:uncharacterized protein n=1 Tax=Berkeleyomyces rouxiae TaxID=2035830 RepID=UPI003B767EC2